MRRFLPLFAAAFLSLTVARAETLVVSAAASLGDVLKEIGAKYQAAGNAAVTFNFGASGFLARQIEESAPVDIFISADEAQMDRLQKNEKIDPATRADLLTNKLVVVAMPATAEKIHNLVDLKNVDHLSIGDPKTVPAGTYAQELLTKQGLWEGLQSKIVRAENVRAALAVVEAGNADAGIVYETDARTTHTLIIAVTIPPEQSPKIVYPMAVVASTRERPEAIKFMQFLKSKEATDLFRAAGFGVVP